MDTRKTNGYRTANNDGRNVSHRDNRRRIWSLGVSGIDNRLGAELLGTTLDQQPGGLESFQNDNGSLLESVGLPMNKVYRLEQTLDSLGLYLLTR